MTTIKSYVPILRWRTAEMQAYERLYPQDREAITPFIEFIMPPPKTDKDDRRKIVEDSKNKFLRQLPDVGKRLVKYCGKNSMFLDVHLLDGDIRASAFESILSSASAVDLFSIPIIHIIPVVGTDADMATREVAVKYAKIGNRGLCIRIDNSHFKDENLAKHIEDFIKDHALDIKNVDILVDLQIVDKSITAESVIEKFSHIPHINDYRSFILSGGAFPQGICLSSKSLRVIRLIETIGSYGRKSSIVENLKEIRLFSDYTIQHPIFMGMFLEQIQAQA